MCACHYQGVGPGVFLVSLLDSEGRFLAVGVVAVPVPEIWLVRVAEELRLCAQQFCPVVL